MNHSLTEAQKRIRNFIAERIDATGIPPTLREIAAQFRVSLGTVQDHVAALEKKGAIRRMRGARGITIPGLPDTGKKVRLPVLGRVAAGLPVEAISHVHEYLSVDEAIAKQANFVLRIKGDSMEPEMHEGDLVLVKSTETAENGEVVIAYFEDEGEATVKTFRKQDGEVFLEAANPKYAPIKGRPFLILGKVTSLIRTFF